MSKNELATQQESIADAVLRMSAGELNACYACLHENLAARIFEGSAV